MNIDGEKELKENVNNILEEIIEQKENYKDERKLIRFINCTSYNFLETKVPVH